MTKTPASNTVKELPGYPVQNSPSGNYSWGGAVGRVEIVYDIVWMGCLGRTPWTELRTPVCSYPIDVFHLSFNFLCLLFLYSIYLCGWALTLSSSLTVNQSQAKDMQKFEAWKENIFNFFLQHFCTRPIAQPTKNFSKLELHFNTPEYF